ncbi:hypothetical protein IMSAGC014_01303 [Bacteroidaceae bacterium]|uniref:MATE family efflux transporter n=1 Tax=uncultured Bacteroides sp. TaxID=162156 RepID=UPI000CEA6719|nr:MATE family efflux transporter [uncultured Bacteroides sp.]GFI34801.1 hypothetical protein IMSAGC014_01303 [Bacteroidaceae bacterium]
MLNKSRLLSIEKRSSRTILNIAASFLIKGWAGIIQIILVPLILLCLGEYIAGIWLTVSSLLVWVESFDLGLGNGLRNKLAECVAKNDWHSARQAVSTTFIIIAILVIPLIIIALGILFNIDIYNILNVDRTIVSDLHTTITATIIVIGFTFILKIVGNIYLGLQLPAINNLLVVLGQSLAALGLYIFHLYFGTLTLLQVALISTIAPVMVYTCAYPITFHFYKSLRPSWHLFEKKMVNELFTKGMQFFVLQVAGIILFLSSNVLISSLLSPAEVTPYQIVYRYFSFATMLFGILVTPLWTAATDAYTKQDFVWIRNVTKRMKYCFLLFVILIIIMSQVAPYIYRIWVGENVFINPALTFMMSVYTIILIYSLYFAHILFGIGHIRLQMYVTLAEAVVFFPLAIIGAKVGGTPGIVAALSFVNIFCAVTNTIQYKKIITGTASGIWIK